MPQISQYRRLVPLGCPTAAAPKTHWWAPNGFLWPMGPDGPTRTGRPGVPRRGQHDHGRPPKITGARRSFEAGSGGSLTRRNLKSISHPSQKGSHAARWDPLKPRNTLGFTRRNVQVTPKDQAIFCRRRHQPRRPTPAIRRPGRPAPTMGAGTGLILEAATASSSPKKAEAPLAKPPVKLTSPLRKCCRICSRRTCRDRHSR